MATSSTRHPERPCASIGRTNTAGAGFSLVEVLVASAILAAGVLALAQLFLLATRANLEAMHATRGVLLASQKVEELRSCCSAPAADPPAASAGTALRQDTPGFVEYLDRDGRVLGVTPPAPRGTVYVRRWSLLALAGADAGLVVQVLVTPHFAPTPPDQEPGRRPGETRLAALLQGGVR